MSQLAIALTIALVVICALWYAFFFCYLRPFRCNVPGPIPFPLVGCWPYLIWPRRTTLEPIRREPIECYWLGTFGTRPVIFVCDPELVKQIATEHREVIHDRGMRDAVAVLAGKSKDSILTSRGKLWQRQRKAILPELNTNEFLDNYFNRCNHELDDLLDSLSVSNAPQQTPVFDQVDAGKKPKAVCPFGHSAPTSEVMYHSMAAVGAEALFGFGDPAEHPSYFKAGVEGQRMDRFTSYWSMIASIPLLPLTWWRRLAAGPLINTLTHHSEMEAMPEEHCEYVREEMKRTSHLQDRYPLLKSLINLGREEIDAGDPADLANDRVVANIIGLMNGVSKNEAAKVCYALSELARQPELQIRLFDEINQYLGDSPPESRQQLMSLPFLEAVVNEVLRLNPAFPVTAKIVERDMELGGYRVCRDAEVAIRNRSLQTHPNYWDRPESFDPQRHLNSDRKPVPYTFIPFGIGRRKCPGSTLACTGIALTLCRIIQRFEVGLPFEGSVPQKRLSMTISYRGVTELRFVERSMAASAGTGEDSQHEPTESIQ